jgi:putative transposase
MPRRPRRLQWTEEACYHLMDRGHNRETIFGDDADHAFFLRLVRRYQQRFGFRLYHYCLMSNHFHLLVQLSDPQHVSRLMAGLLRAYVHYFHRRYGFWGHLFQGRFKSPAIQCETYLLSCGRYIERNPLDAGLVTEPWAYRWSSARAYALGVADDLLAPNPYYERLGSSPNECQEQWRRFLLGTDEREEAIRRGEGILGDEAFRSRVWQVQGRPAPRGRGRPRQINASVVQIRSESIAGQ